MKLLLVNDTGQLLASLEDLERYDAQKPGHLFALLDLMEALVAAAKGRGDMEKAAALSLSKVLDTKLVKDSAQ
jgi:hypothetical protein